MRGAYVSFPSPEWTLDIEIYSEHGDAHWAQARYLVHTTDDVLWTDDIDAALMCLRRELERLERRENEQPNVGVYD